MAYNCYSEAIRARVSRATAEANALQGAMEDFGEKLAEDVVEEGDDVGGRSKWVFRGPNPEVPIDWSVRVGDFLHNLRASLNYIVYQSILDKGGQPTGRTAFPMADHRDRWEEESRKVGSASEEDRQLIEYFQPYTGGLNLDCDVSVLEEIVKLSNQDRHRSPVNIEIRWSFNASPLNDLYEAVPGISLDVRPVPTEIKSGQVLLDINVDPSRYVDVHECFQVQFFVATQKPFTPLSHLLRESLRFVNEFLRVRELPGYGGIARPTD